MEKDLIFAELYGIYKDLLTPHQQKIVNSYYILDLSLGEIAEENGISRQSVNDALSKARVTLKTFEEKLGVYSKTESLIKLAGELKSTNPKLYKKIMDVLSK